MEWLLDPHSWLALATLIAPEMLNIRMRARRMDAVQLRRRVPRGRAAVRLTSRGALPV